MGFCKNKYNVSSTAPATEVLKNWRGCCCCLRWCCCFAAKKQALPCLNILFSRNLKTLYKWLPWLSLHSVPSANWQASQRLRETTTRAQSSPMPDTQSRELKGPKPRLQSAGRQVGETDSQANETTREGDQSVDVGLLTEQRIPSFQTTPSIRGFGCYESKIGQPGTDC